MLTKVCTKCKKEKELSEFNYHPTCKYNKNSKCKTCEKEYKLKYKQNNKDKIYRQKQKHYKQNKIEILKKVKIYRINNKENIKINKKRYYQENINYFKQRNRLIKPWNKHLSWIKNRCNNKNADNYKYYGGKGIKCRITVDDLKMLWFRDKAYLLDRPSIDREDSNGNYEYKNCQFIEHVLNISKTNRYSLIKSVLQYDLNGNFIKEWKSIAKASSDLNINTSNIGQVCCHKRKTAGNFKWEFKNV